jgi:hypothetical protein
MLKSSKSNKYCARATRARRTATLTLVFRETVPIRRPRSTKPLPGRRKKLSHQPQILIFDVDGVLVDVRGTLGARLVTFPPTTLYTETDLSDQSPLTYCIKTTYKMIGSGVQYATYIFGKPHSPRDDSQYASKANSKYHEIS